jgi:hypothetical protein
MLKQSVAILTVDQARELLVVHYADHLLSSRENLMQLIRDGKLYELPNLKTADANHVVRLFRDNSVGAQIAVTENVPLVVVNANGTLLVVYTASPPPPVVPVGNGTPLDDPYVARGGVRWD